MSKNNRVLALIALMAAGSFVVPGVLTVASTSDTNEVASDLAQLTDLRILYHDLVSAVHNEEAGLDDYVLTGEATALDRYDEAVALEQRIFGQFHAAAVDVPRLRSGLDRMAAVSAIWQNRMAAPAIAAVAADDAAALARFIAQAADDNAGIESAIESINAEFVAAGEDIAKRQAGTATLQMVGITAAFGFLTFAFSVALVAVRRFGHALELDTRQASVLNRFTEVTSFATDDHQVAVTNLVALGRLAGPDASVTHVLNHSMDRAIPEASTGDAIAEILPLRSLELCAGVLRGTMYVTEDLADDLSVHCPVYPAATGTLACIPLNSGESVGAVHLYWARPNALPLTARPNIVRITEHAALAIGNRRLLAALHGQANTDPRTGLANSRALDVALEVALAARAAHETLSVLMIDVDHFKQFNDRHGHPAGDEALRALGGVLRSCMRDGDVAARYGGEEFVVLLRGVDASMASGVAERIRARTESTIIALAPGTTDRITVSIGVANAPEHGIDRVTLLRSADEALYQAKAAGRNRVFGLTDPGSQRITPAGEGGSGDSDPDEASATSVGA